MLGVTVAKDRAEDFRRALTKQGLVDKTHAIIEDGEMIVLPLTGSPPDYLMRKSSAALVEASFPERGHMIVPIDEIRRLSGLPPSMQDLLPGSWERFGDLAVIRLPKGLDPYEPEVGRAYAAALGLKAVLRETAGIEGEFRRPTTKMIFGDSSVTTHRENHISYRFDAAEIMFSSGNQEERLRMATVSCENETIVDMFAGIGYFSLPLAVYQKPAKIIACELNPLAHTFLCENVDMNGVHGVVEPVLGDNRDLAGEGFADRVIMGYVKTTHLFLPTAIRLLRSGGMLHYHETCPLDLIERRPIERIRQAVPDGSVDLVGLKQIKSYAPGIEHVVVDARVFKPS